MACLCCGGPASTKAMLRNEWCDGCFPCVPSTGLRGPDCPLDELLRPLPIVQEAAPAESVAAPVISLGRARRRRLIAASAARMRRRLARMDKLADHSDDVSDDGSEELLDIAE